MKVRLEDGTEQEVTKAHMGAEWRYEDYVYLKMMEREWKRPLNEQDKYLEISETVRPSARASVVVAFWSYFETRIERLVWDAMSSLPLPIAEELLKRYVVIGARVDRLYRLLFSTTYWNDLTDLGFADVSALLQRVQAERNSFAHWRPGAIPDQSGFRFGGGP